MVTLASVFRTFRADCSGATSIEYVIIGAMLSICIVAGARSIGVNLSPKFTAVASNLQ